MANNSVITLEKPMPHLGLADWHGRMTQIRNVSEARRQEAFDFRHASRTLRNETRIQADWNTYHTNTSISDRIGDLQRWRTTVMKILERIEKDMALLREEKAATERELESMVTPLLIVSECLTQRDGRLGSELTYDDGDTELKKELCVIENNNRLLRDQCQAAWDKLNRLEEIKFKLSLEIANKNEAEEIDLSQLDLNRFSANITFKPDATRVPKNSCTYEAWLEHTKRIKQLAENELADTYAIRESLFVCREKANNLVKAQQDRTEHALRKRIFEIQRNRNELEWQKLKMKEEMEKCSCEVRTLEDALRHKVDALKLAESRLENRAQRAGMELCLDEPYEKLCSEALQLRRIMKSLSDKINCAKTTYTTLEDQALKISNDLENKQHALMVDIRGLDMRAKLKTGQYAECTSASAQTDRNIQLTKMEDEIPPS